jgi:hypothetical protein
MVTIIAIIVTTTTITIISHLTTRLMVKKTKKQPVPSS